jgi:hypothetical protein
MSLPTTSPTVMPHERTGRLPISTVQAPHCWIPQPYLVPVRPTVSRIAQSSGVSSSTSTNRFLPLIFNSVISFSYNKVVELFAPEKQNQKVKLMFQTSFCLPIGRWRMRFPVAANIAFVIEGATGKTPISTPFASASLSIRFISISGISFILAIL